MDHNQSCHLSGMIFERLGLGEPTELVLYTGTGVLHQHRAPGYYQYLWWLEIQRQIVHQTHNLLIR